MFESLPEYTELYKELQWFFVNSCAVKDPWDVGNYCHFPDAELVWLKKLFIVGKHLAGIPVTLQTTDIWLSYSEWWKLVVTKF